MAVKGLFDFRYQEQFVSGETRTFIFDRVDHERYSLLVAMRGPGGDSMNVAVQLEINDQFINLDQATGGMMQLGKIFAFTNEDIHGRMRVVITAGATPPTGGVDIEVWGMDTVKPYKRFG